MWLTQQGIAFEDRNIRENDTYFNEAIQLGATQTPVTLVIDENEEQSVIHGFDKTALQQALND
ncbi:glutaredoxin family protein [Brevibacillus humidisoli]|uniref:glutaredoxin family protein n=1 Tax=Brevibacillus humidisoli TaxID=2895522 RepID=UPI003B97CF2B